jgi:DNA-binding beta-propeller fold protein YncE
MRAWIAAFTVLAGLTLALPASAPAGIVQLPRPHGCLSGDDARCTPLHDAAASTDFVLSPDGTNAYATDADRLLVFDRDALTGHLAQRPGPGGSVRLLRSSGNLAIAPDGETLYVASSNDGAILVFDRDPATGALAQKPGDAGCIAEDIPECRTAEALHLISDVALAPDGRNLYVVSGFPYALTALTVAGDGSLTQTPDGAGSFGCVAATAVAGCATGPPLDGLSSVAVSADGRNVFAAAGTDQSVASLTRNATTGGLTPIAPPGGCVSANRATGCNRVPELNRAVGMVSGLASNRIYVYSDYRILVLDRAPNGTLKRHAGVTGCVSDWARPNCSAGRGVDAGQLAISPDGKHLYGSGAAVTEHRILPDGGIAQRAGARGCVSPDWGNRPPIAGCAHAVGMASPKALAVTPDGRFVYASDFLLPDYDDPRQAPNSYLVFRRTLSNVVCGRSTVTVVRGTTRALPLPCSDADRNPFTTSIVTRPKLGSLGAIDQSAHTVRYIAPKRRTGRTTFTFTSAYGSQRSGVGSMTVIVRRSKPKRIRGVRLSIGFRAVHDRTVLTRLRLRGVPRRTKVTAKCTHRGHRCAGAAGRTLAKRRAHGTVGLGKRFVGVELPARTRITVVVSKPGMIGTARLVTMRAGARPLVTRRCVPLGTTQPRRHC